MKQIRLLLMIAKHPELNERCACKASAKMKKRKESTILCVNQFISIKKIMAM
jgi:hypothetical protein